MLHMYINNKLISKAGTSFQKPTEALTCGAATSISIFSVQVAADRFSFSLLEHHRAFWNHLLAVAL
jgi:hypothetical protein